MSKLRTVLAALPFILAAAPAAAQTLDPPDAVAYLLVGIQEGASFELNGMSLYWEKTAPGVFRATGPQDFSMIISAAQQGSSCIYDLAVDMSLGAEKYQQKAGFDFSKITGMTFTSETTAQIEGSGYCIGADQSMCSPSVSFSVPTDAATFDKVYADFRAGACP